MLLIRKDFQPTRFGLSSKHALLQGTDRAPGSFSHPQGNGTLRSGDPAHDWIGICASRARRRERSFGKNILESWQTHLLIYPNLNFNLNRPQRIKIKIKIKIKSGRIFARRLLPRCPLKVGDHAIHLYNHFFVCKACGAYVEKNFPVPAFADVGGL